MLVLSRKSQEAIVVGGSGGFQQTLVVRVLEIGRGCVKLGFEADATIPVYRWEIWERIQAGARPDRPAGGAATPVS